ncbi:hypothetical protein [Sphingopyxis sp. PET50]|uniref:hypothetical protein n=1 Tax=Sphingopyxis sp. PET50 TaxID=2976533 RepID=UPI0021B07B3A|nr:hypothetical protein [Sphingopyxis sp. PET50]
MKGETALKLSDGREFTLVSGFRAFVIAEKNYGAPIDKVQEDAQAGYLGAGVTIFHAMLAVRHPEISIDEAGEILVAEREAVLVAISEAAANGAPKAKAEGRKPGNGASAGTSSGRSGAKPASIRKPSGTKRSAPSR